MQNKVLEKNTLSFFLRWVCRLLKNDSVFWAEAIKFLRGGFKKRNLFFEALALETVSVVVRLVRKLFVQSTKVSS
jgi:hypothetical protein